MRRLSFFRGTRCASRAPSVTPRPPLPPRAGAKLDKEDRDFRVSFALVDGHVEKIGNVTIEPPGLFRGRGKHPKMGVVKRRIMPEEVTINIAPGAPVPPCPVPGHSWKRVVHDPTITWLAFWTDPVGGNHKYVYLAASSSFKGHADRDKYEKARRLRVEIPRSASAPRPRERLPRATSPPPPHHSPRGTPPPPSPPPQLSPRALRKVDRGHAGL